MLKRLPRLVDIDGKYIIPRLVGEVAWFFGGSPGRKYAKSQSTLRCASLDMSQSCSPKLFGLLLEETRLMSTAS